MKCIDNFRTIVPVNHDSPIGMNVHSRIMLMGSCFSDNIGTKLTECGLDARVNPAGALYNPLSIAGVLRAAMSDKRLSDTMVFEYAGRTRSWLFPTRFSSPSSDAANELFNNTLAEIRGALSESDVLIFTFGTAWVYQHIPCEMSAYAGIVSNCHKVPAAHFTRYRLSVSDIVNTWRPLLHDISCLRGRHTDVIFTVSPIRHFKDGAHENTLSKSTLQLAVSELADMSEGGMHIDYFPAYELLMDDLRDYRFYADDMLHPSPVAVNYIWQHFQDTYFSSADREQLAASARQYKRTQHRELLIDNLHG